MSRLSIDQIANANDLPEQEVEVPSWGGNILIRVLTKAQQKSVRTAAVINDAFDDELLELGILCEAIVDPPITREHMAILRNKNANVIDEILNAIYEMNSLDKGALKAARAEFQGESGTVDGLPHSEDSEDVSETDESGTDN